MENRQRILVTVKTYPTISQKYGEVVCTAGVREDGSWIRLYPVPFRRLDKDQKYKKFNWIECDVAKHRRDPRPESFRPVRSEELVPVKHMGTENEWSERRRLLLETCPVYTNMSLLIDGAKANTMSLSVFKPSRLLKFSWREDAREWPDKKEQQMQAILKSKSLYGDDTWKETFQVVSKLPYIFFYEFEDETGKKSKMRVLDWEIGALYWRCFRKTNDEQITLDMVKEKYWNQFTKKDLHFFLGTMQSFHLRAPNPWVIIGVFPIPHQKQPSLL